ncbi:hypothetical protein GGE07_006097 [Sinorhizobium terangae]|nr:hypothetical protein [Sinorhizobium terangae]
MLEMRAPQTRHFRCSKVFKKHHQLSKVTHGRARRGTCCVSAYLHEVNHKGPEDLWAFMYRTVV